MLVSHWLVFLISLLNFETSSSFDLFGLLSGGSGSRSSRRHDLQPVSDEKAAQYLQNFGYVQPSAMLQSSSGFAADMQDVKSMLNSAIRKFQEFAGLEPTGKLDVATKKKMAEPRCGLMDVRAISTTREAAYRWKKNRLTYSIESYSPDLPHDDISKAIRHAFRTWSEVVPLDFTEVSRGDESADIKIKFAAQNHGDPWPFDGRGGVLAHATMPTSGLLHFDEDENWVYMDSAKIASGYTDLLAVAIHESGHTLGLDHSRNEDSIMAPFYQETVDSSGNYIMPKLKRDDIEAIQDIYGQRRGGLPSDEDDNWGSSGSSGRGSSGSGDSDRWGSGWGSGGSRDRATTPSWRESPTTRKTSIWDRLGGFFGHDDDEEDRAIDRNRGHEGSSNRGRTEESFETPASSGGFNDCPQTLDAFSTGLGGVNYIFQGSKVYELRGNRVVKTHSLRTLFPRGPIYVDAAFANDRSNTMMLFQSYQVYAFHKRGSQFVLDSDFPKRVPSNMRFNPTGAILWNDGHQILFSSSGDFAVYDEYWNQATSVNKVSNYFPSLPLNVKGGFPDSQGVMTLFTAARVVKYDARRKILMGAGQLLTQYLNC
uniref:Peptidase metallopeptidase domain-containing protein n=1 Tax=Acrobeloides nanus TaxID=290746 RepID=A0A914D5R0_9BILA